MWLLFSLISLPNRATDAAVFERISPNEGLSQSSVFSILQDRKGYLWLATSHGLNQFDGYRFTSYTLDVQDPTTLSDNFTICLYEDSAGVIWVGTYQGGLNRLDSRTKSFSTYRNDPSDPHSLSHNRVYALIEDGHGDLWVGTGHGLNRFDRRKGRFQRFFHEPEVSTSLSGNRIRALCKDREGNLWVGAQGGLCRFQGGEAPFIRYVHDPHDPNSLSDNRVSSIVEDRNGYLWVGTKSGLNRFDPDSGRFLRFQHDSKTPQGLSHDDITAIHEDRRGRLWVGTARGGLNQFDRERNRFIHHGADPENPGALPHPHVLALSEDRSGILWIGTLFGISKLDPNAARFGHLSMEPARPESTDHNLILSIHEQPSGRLWVGTHGDGLKRIDRGAPEKMRSYTQEPDTPDSLSNNQVWAIQAHDETQLWLGTSRGLNRMDLQTGSFTAIRHDPANPKSLSNDRVFSLLKDRSGRLWAGTGDGLNRLEDGSHGSFQRFRHDPSDPASLSQGNIWALHQDRDGNLWVGTHGGGLNRLNASETDFTRYRADPSRPDALSHDGVWCIHEDEVGALWIGTAGGGLNRMDPSSGRFSHYRQKDGLIDDVVYGILGDGNGHLWMSTNRGLAWFDPDTVSFRSFDIRDGLQNHEFNAGAYFQSATGEMFFGGIRGLNLFYPEDIGLNPTPPNVVLTDLLLLGVSISEERLPVESPLGEAKTIPMEETLVLNHRQDHFSIEFAALDFSKPQKNRYAYQLEGFDTNWHHTDADRRLATYTGLPAGAYRFRVRGANGDGVWNREGATLAIRVLPPPWRAWWAITLYLLGFSLLTWGGFQLLVYRKRLEYERFRNAHLQRVDQLKDDFLQRASQELRAPLNSISALAESLMEGATGRLAKPTQDHLAMIAASGRRLADLVDDILDLSRLEQDGPPLRKRPVDLHSLTDVVLNLSLFLIGGKPTELINEVERDLPLVEADENRLKQILHHLIAHILETSFSGSIRVGASLEDDRVLVQVRQSSHRASGGRFQPAPTPYKKDPNLRAGELGKTNPGLALLDRLVTLHGGRLRIQGSREEGLCAGFHLPTSERRREPTPIKNPLPAGATHSQNPAVNGRDAFHVLVVDDEQVERQVLVNLLSLQGYRVSESADGPEALQAVEQDSSIDLILLDILLPGLSGYEVCRQIRKRFPAQALPILFLTAGNQRDDWSAGFQAGGNDHLSKPVLREELLARVAFHLEFLEIHRALDTKVEEKTREVRELHELKNQFFTNISHELRTPLTLIFGPLKELLEHIGTASKRRLRQQLMRVMANTKQLSKLIDQLLDISKLEAGGMRLEASQGNIAAFAADQIRAFSPWAEGKQVELTLQSEREKVFASFDADKMEKILGNLLSNALKFTDGGGKILIKIQERGAWVHISVRDTGRGIPARLLPHVFNRFYQGPGAPTNGTSNGGIGLSLAQELARLHGGDIIVKSEPGFGSEFTVLLPRGETRRHESATQSRSRTPEPVTLNSISGLHCKEPEPGAREAENGRQTGHDPEATVLLVEDHPDLRAYLVEILRPHYRVLEASDGKQGLALTTRHHPDLVLSDVLMPELDGRQLCLAIKKNPRTRHIPILLLTVKSSANHKIAGFAAGADDYLTKPFNPRELLARVRGLIKSRQILRARFSKEFLLQPTQKPISSADAEFLQKAKAVVERNLEDPRFDVDSFAEEAGVSIRHFRRKLKALSGQTPSAFIRSFRLEFAAQLIQQRAGSVAEVARRSGFLTVRNFSKLFRQHFGVTPSAYPGSSHPKTENDGPPQTSADSP